MTKTDDHPRQNPAYSITRLTVFGAEYAPTFLYMREENDMNAFQGRQYRNVLKEIGKTDEEITRRLSEVWDTFFYDEEERIFHTAGDDMGYLEDTGNHDARTEGMSYGMMMCVQMDKKDEFDRIWIHDRALQ